MTSAFGRAKRDGLLSVIRERRYASAAEMSRALGLKEGGSLRSTLKVMRESGLIHIAGYAKGRGAGSYTPYYAVGEAAGSEPDGITGNFVTVGYDECVTRAADVVDAIERKSRVGDLLRGVPRRTEFAGGRNPWLR